MSSIPTYEEFAQPFRARNIHEQVIQLVYGCADQVWPLRWYKRIGGTHPLTRYHLSPKPKIPEVLRQWVLLRDDYRCVQCGSTDQLQCDHIVSERRGGPTSFQNLQTLCKKCNQRKGSLR